MKHLRTFTAALAVPLLVAVPAAFAQPPAKPDSAAPERREEHEGDRRRELWERIRAMRVWKMTEELKLDEAQIAKAYPLISRFDEREGELARERAHTSRALRQLVDTPNPNPTELNRLVEVLVANKSKRNALEEERTKALRKLLTPVQQAKLVLLMPKLDDMMRERIKEAMERHGEHRH